MPQIQVLPSAPNFGSQLAQVLAQAGGDIGQGLIQRGQNRKSEALMQRLKDPSATVMQKIDAAYALSQNMDPKRAEVSLPYLNPYIYSNPTEPSQNQMQQPGQQDNLQETPSGQQFQQPQQGGNSFSNIQDDQLTLLAGLPKGGGDIAKAELQRRDNSKKQNLKQAEFEYKRAGPILAEADALRKNIPTLRNSFDTLTNSIKEGNIGGFDLDYLANATGIEPLRSPKGALFLSAGKEFFLGNLSRAGTRPNQWIEQQLVKLQPEIGRNQEANLSVAEFMKFKIDTDEAWLKAVDNVSEQYKQNTGYVPGDVGVIADKMIKPYVEQRQKELAYDLRELHEQYLGPKNLMKLEKVPKGTPLTIEKAKVFLDRAEGNEERAAEAARRLGYDIVGEEIYMRNK